MKKKFLGIMSIVIAATMFAAILGACKKGGEDSTPASGSGSKTASASTANISAAASAVKTTAKPTTAAATPSVSSAAGSSAAEDKAGSDSLSDTASDESYVVETESGGKIDIVLDAVKGGDIFDLGGRNITLSCYGDIFNKSLSEVNNPVFRSRIKAAEKKYNCKFVLDAHVMDMTAWDKEVLSATIAGVKYADAIRTMSSVAFPVHILRNIAVPLDDYLDFDSPIMKVNQYQDKGTFFFGRHWGLTNGDSIFSNQALMVNSEIIQREGQPDILDLVERNQWTWDAFLEIVKNCTRDYDGNGIYDQWGISSNASNMLAMALLAANGCTIIDDLGKGYEYALNSGPAIRALQFFADLMLVHKVVKFDVNIYTKGQAAMYYGYLQSYRNETWIAGGLKSQLIPHPMGPDVSYYQNISTFAFTEVLSTCDIPREVAIIMNDVYLLWDENLAPIPEVQAQIDRIEKEQGIPYWKQISRNRCLTEREFQACYVEVTKHYKPDVSYGYPGLLNLMTSLLSDPVMKGTVSVSQAVASARDQIQAIVDQFK